MAARNSAPVNGWFWNITWPVPRRLMSTKRSTAEAPHRRCHQASSAFIVVSRQTPNRPAPHRRLRPALHSDAARPHRSRRADRRRFALSYRPIPNRPCARGKLEAIATMIRFWHGRACLSNHFASRTYRMTHHCPCTHLDGRRAAGAGPGCTDRAGADPRAVRPHHGRDAAPPSTTRPRATSAPSSAAASAWPRGSGQSGSNRALRTVVGAAAGRSVGNMASRSQAFEYTVLIGGSNTIRIVSDQAGKRVGDCVSVEQGQFDNIRLVADSRCSPPPAGPRPAAPAATPAPAPHRWWPAGRRRSRHRLRPGQAAGAGCRHRRGLHAGRAAHAAVVRRVTTLRACGCQRGALSAAQPGNMARPGRESPRWN